MYTRTIARVLHLGLQSHILETARRCFEGFGHLSGKSVSFVTPFVGCTAIWNKMYFNRHISDRMSVNVTEKNSSRGNET